MARQLLSIVVPVFNEEEGIGESYRRLTAVASGLADLDYELVLVDDGSRDGTYAILRALATADPRLRLLRFSRNFGHQAAITAGIDAARGDAVVVIDADLQDPPEVIAGMVAEWRGGADVVYGQREVREGESPLRLAAIRVFYGVLRRMSTVDIPVDVGDFRLMSRRAADQLRGMREHDRYLRGLVSWMGFRQTALRYRREPRAAGETKYPFSKLLKLALDGITSFSMVPLRLATWLGYAASLVAFVYLADVLVQKWTGNPIRGWASLMVAILFLGGVQLITLGILGAYVGRIFTEVKGRPLYIVDEAVNIEPPGPG